MTFVVSWLPFHRWLVYTGQFLVEQLSSLLEHSGLDKGEIKEAFQNVQEPLSFTWLYV